jgi:hypothetical protein
MAQQGSSARLPSQHDYKKLADTQCLTADAQRLRRQGGMPDQMSDVPNREALSDSK